MDMPEAAVPSTATSSRLAVVQVSVLVDRIAEEPALVLELDLV